MNLESNISNNVFTIYRNFQKKKKLIKKLHLCIYLLFFFFNLNSVTVRYKSQMFKYESMSYFFPQFLIFPHIATFFLCINNQFQVLKIFINIYTYRIGDTGIIWEWL